MQTAEHNLHFFPLKPSQATTGVGKEHLPRIRHWFQSGSAMYKYVTLSKFSCFSKLYNFLF